MIDRAQRRLLLALVASALLHWWLAHTADSPGARRMRAAGSEPVRATLATPEVDGTAPQTVPRVSPLPESRVEQAANSNRRTAAAVTSSVAAHVSEPRATVASNGTAAYTQPSDPTYYAARSLDVYPKALTTLDLGAQHGAVNVRATVFIDESGSVNDVRAIEASAAEIERAARDLLMRTRFTPAIKDGRVVKAQVLLSLDYRATSAP